MTDLLRGETGNSMESELVTGELQLIEQTPQQAKRFGEQFLGAQLLPATNVLLSVAQLIEVLVIPVGQVIPIPDLPAWVMGVYNWRGEILWITDLAALIGLPPLFQSGFSRSSYSVIVIHAGSERSQRRSISQATGQKLLGLAVNQIIGMEWCDPGLIQSPPGFAVTPELAPFLRGYWLKEKGDLLTVLDSGAIIARMPQAVSSE
jgi:positive phototaxis protein PixI